MCFQTAESNLDFSGVQSLRISFSSSDSELFFQVAITDDQLLEEIESFFGVLTLAPGSVGVSLGDDRAMVTIIDDDGTCVGMGGERGVKEMEGIRGVRGRE